MLEKKRSVLIHSLYKRLPKPLREVLLACYVGTGCDYISKIGTKLRALSAFPEKFLQKFGHKDLDDSDIVKAEQYLVNVPI